MHNKVSFVLNGSERTAECKESGFGVSLLEHLREVEHLKGAKRSCGQGGCGSCTVAVDGKTVFSCITPLMALEGKHVTTPEATRIEGPVKALVELGGSQCGFCTAGVAMSLSCIGSGTEHPVDEATAFRALDGHICRCTGYRPIMDAARKACANACGGALRDVEDLVRGSAGATGSASPAVAATAASAAIVKASSSLSSSSSSKIGWLRPSTLDELQQIRVSNLGKTSFVAGGTSAGIYGPQWLNPPAAGGVMIDITRVEELNEFRIVDEGKNEIHGLYFGAAMSINQVAEKLMEHASRAPTTYPAIANHLFNIASTQVRNAGTWAGNLLMQKKRGFASDFCCVALAANFLIRVSPLPGASEVTVALDNFWDLPEDLLVVNMTIPFHKPHQSFFSLRTSLRPWNSHALAIAAALLTVEQATPDAGKVVMARVAYGALGARAVRCKSAEAALCAGHLLADGETGAAAIAAAGAAAKEVEIVPIREYFTVQQPEGKEAFRKQMVPNLLLGILAKAREAHEAARAGLPPPSATQLPLSLSRAAPSGTQTVPEVAKDRASHVGDAARHATGKALYTDDLPAPATCLYAALVYSRVARATIVSVDPAPALAVPGIVSFIGPSDIPNNALDNGEEVLASSEIHHFGQPLGLIVSSVSQAHANKAAGLVKVNVETHKPIFSIDDAIMENSFFTESERVIASGPEVDQVLSSPETAHVIKGTVTVNSQLHFYMEKVGALVTPDEGGRIIIDSVTQFPENTKIALAAALKLSPTQVTFRMRRTGGAFGGKTSRQHFLQVAVMTAAIKLNRPVKIQQDIWADGNFTGGRHDFRADYRLGLTREGRFTALEILSISNAGCSLDFSGFVAGDYTEGLDCVYHFPSVNLRTRVAKTNLPSKTAYRSFGKVQAVGITEQIIDHAAVTMGCEPEKLRELNFYTDRTAITPFGLRIENFGAPEIYARVKARAQVEKRQAEVEEFNRTHPHTKRGIASLAIKFPVSHLHSNGASVMVSISGSGAVTVHHSGCEIGQGINEKVARAVAKALRCPYHLIRIADINTDVLPNMPVTGGSATSEINVAAALLTCDVLKDRLRPILSHLSLSDQPTLTESQWTLLTSEAAKATVNLSATSNYKSPARSGHAENPIGSMSPWNASAAADYYVFASATCEAEIDTFTGESRVVRVDLEEDTGVSLNPTIDIGQIEGAFVQGIGYFMREDVLYDHVTGKNNSNDTWEYKPPLVSDIPEVFNVDIGKGLKNGKGILGAKAVGEPPYLLSYVCFDAVRRAVRSARLQLGKTPFVHLSPPCTPDRILQAINHE